MIPIDALRSVNCIYVHTRDDGACADGMAAALLLADALPEATIHFVCYNSSAHRAIVPAPGMLFCDIVPYVTRGKDGSLDIESQVRLAGFAAMGTIVLDHHRGAADIVAGFGERGVFADEKMEPGVSGATLACCHVWAPLRAASLAPGASGYSARQQSSFEEARAAHLATLAGIRDTWQTADPHWPAACAQAAALRFYTWETLRKAGLGPDMDRLLAIGPILIAKDVERDTRSIAEAYRFKVSIPPLPRWPGNGDPTRCDRCNDRLTGTHTCPTDYNVICFEGTNTSDIAERLEGDVDLVLGWHYKIDDGKPKMVVSCRGRGGFPVLAFATANDGGGHENASGFTRDLDGCGTNPYATLQELVLRFVHHQQTKETR